MPTSRHPILSPCLTPVGRVQALSSPQPASKQGFPSPDCISAPVFTSHMPFSSLAEISSTLDCATHRHLPTRQSNDKSRSSTEDSEDEFSQLSFPIGRLMSLPFSTPEVIALYHSSPGSSSKTQVTASRQALEERLTHGHSSRSVASLARLSSSKASVSSFTGSELVLDDPSTPTAQVKKTKLVTRSQALREHFRYGRSSCSSNMTWSSGSMSPCGPATSDLQSALRSATQSGVTLFSAMLGISPMPVPAVTPFSSKLGNSLAPAPVAGLAAVMHTATAGPTPAATASMDLSDLTIPSVSAPDGVTSTDGSRFQSLACAQQPTPTAATGTERLVSIATGSKHASSSLSAGSFVAGVASHSGIDSSEHTSRPFAGPHSSAAFAVATGPSAAAGSCFGCPVEFQITTSPNQAPATTPLASVGSQVRTNAFSDIM